jgi:hypothetical protein
MSRTITCGLLLLAAGPLWGQEREIPPDVQLTYEVRKALLRDSVLGPLNLGVKVKGRVALLWGPVPSAEVAGRAVSLLEKMPGLTAVKNELEIDPELNASPQYLPETLPQESRLPRKGDHLSPATLTTRNLPSKAGGPSFPPVAVPPTTIPGMPDNREIEIALPSLRIPGTEPESAKSPEEAIADLQKNSRFAAVQVRIQNGIVTLSADTDQVQALYELARRISGIPGIQRVVVQER